MTAPALAAQSRETSGGVTMATGSLVSVSMECGPGSVTGCSAVNNDLVVCAAQECCNVWEYSTQSKGGEREGEGVETHSAKAWPVRLWSKEWDRFTLSLLLSSYKKKCIIG